MKSSNGNGGKWRWTAGVLATACVLLAGGFGKSITTTLDSHAKILREHDISISAFKASLIRIEEKLDLLLVK